MQHVSINKNINSFFYKCRFSVFISDPEMYPQTFKNYTMKDLDKFRDIITLVSTYQTNVTSLISTIQE
jgi:hypothetical protein